MAKTGLFQELSAGWEAEISDSYLVSESVSYPVNSSLDFPHGLIKEDSGFYDIDHICTEDQQEACGGTEHGPGTSSGSIDDHASPYTAKQRLEEDPWQAVYRDNNCMAEDESINLPSLDCLFTTTRTKVLIRKPTPENHHGLSSKSSGSCVKSGKV